jgi:hypothetical protein
MVYLDQSQTAHEGAGELLILQVTLYCMPFSSWIRQPVLIKDIDAVIHHWYWLKYQAAV